MTNMLMRTLASRWLYIAKRFIHQRQRRVNLFFFRERAVFQTKDELHPSKEGTRAEVRPKEGETLTAARAAILNQYRS